MDRLIYNKRQNGDVACAFGGFGNHSLMAGTCSGGAPRNDFASIIDEARPKSSAAHRLVIERIEVIGTEHANLAPRPAELARLGWRSTWCSCQRLSVLSSGGSLRFKRVFVTFGGVVRSRSTERVGFRRRRR